MSLSTSVLKKTPLLNIPLWRCKGLPVTHRNTIRLRQNSHPVQCLWRQKHAGFWELPRQGEKSFRLKLGTRSAKKHGKFHGWSQTSIAWQEIVELNVSVPYLLGWIKLKYQSDISLITRVLFQAILGLHKLPITTRVTRIVGRYRWARKDQSWYEIETQLHLYWNK